MSGPERAHEPSRHLLDDLRPADDDLVFQDGLTGLYNRRLLGRFFVESWNLITERCEKFSIIMIDLNLFKEVNDRYGHLSGDDVLRVTAKLLRDHFRNGDVIFRFGGDEFLVLLPGAGKAEAGQLAERARLSMSEHEFLSHDRHETINVPLTFCIGVASYPSDGRTADELISHADALMYKEKQQARRRARSGLRLLSRIAAAVLFALLPALLLLRWDDIMWLRETSGTTRDSSVTAPVEMQAIGADRMQLLEQIERLERQLEEMRSATLNQAAMSSAEIPPSDPPAEADVEQLRNQIEQLTAQLRTGTMRATPPERKVPPPRPAVPVMDPGPVRAPAGPAEVRPPVASEPAPAPIPDVITAPRLLQPIRPRYPRLARRLGKEATVDLIVHIDRSGRVIDARIVGPRPGFGFEEAALEAAMRSTWATGLRNGLPAPMDTGLRVTFRMPR